MLLKDAYRALTPTAKQQAREDILALCDQRGIQCSRDYLTQLMQGLRRHPCSEDLARLVSGYFRGMTGIDVSPEDVRMSIRQEPATEGAAGE